MNNWNAGLIQRLDLFKVQTGLKSGLVLMVGLDPSFVHLTIDIFDSHWTLFCLSLNYLHSPLPLLVIVTTCHFLSLLS